MSCSCSSLHSHDSRTLLLKSGILMATRRTNKLSDCKQRTRRRKGQKELPETPETRTVREWMGVTVTIIGIERPVFADTRDDSRRKTIRRLLWSQGVQEVDESGIPVTCLS